MRPIVRTTIALSALAVLGVPTAAAHADQPTVTPFDDTFSFDADFCAFPVIMTVRNVGYASVVATGGGFRETDHVTETDTMAAFGRSITGNPYAYTVTRTLDAAGQQLGAHAQGVSWSFVLPDGTRVHAAGWQDFNTFATHGDPVDLAPVCAYLAG